MQECDKNLLQTSTEIDKRVLIDHALNCDFHHVVKRDMARSMADKITEKIEFIEENDPGSYSLKVRARVYVFSPEEIKAERELFRLALEDAERRGAAVAEEKAQKRIAELERMNKNQLANTQRLEKELWHIQKLSIDLAMFTPPPLIFCEGQSYEAGKVAGQEESKKRIEELEKKSEGQARAIERLDARCKRKDQHLYEISQIAERH